MSSILVLAFTLSLLVNWADFVEGKENLCQISDIFWWCRKEQDDDSTKTVENDPVVKASVKSTAQLAIDLFVGQNPASLQIEFVR